MKTLYIEKNSHDIKIFRQENSSFQLLQEFSSARQEEYADFLKGLSPEQTYISIENSDFGFWNNIHKSHNPLAWVEKNKKHEIPARINLTFALKNFFPPLPFQKLMKGIFRRA